MPHVGEKAPPFRGVDQHGKTWTLEALLEKGPLVLYFYPRDFTPICTREACAFRDAFEELRELRAGVVGVSIDDAATHRRFAATHQIPFPLLADEDGSIHRTYDAVAAFGLYRRRVTFVVDTAGTIRAAIHHQMSARRHADEVRAALRALS